MENLYELVAGFGEEKAEKYPHIFLGVAYAFENTGVKNRPDDTFSWGTMLDVDDLHVEGMGLLIILNSLDLYEELFDRWICDHYKSAITIKVDICSLPNMPEMIFLYTEIGE